MGEHADDIINGDVDEVTGEWLGNGQGFPRSVTHEYYHSFENQLNGIRKFVRKNCSDPVEKKLMEYAKWNDIDPTDIQKIVAAIQSDFKDFLKFIHDPIRYSGNVHNRKPK